MQLESNFIFTLQVNHKELRLICLALAGVLPPKEQENAIELNKAILARREKVTQDYYELVKGVNQKAQE